MPGRLQLDRKAKKKIKKNNLIRILYEVWEEVRGEDNGSEKKRDDNAEIAYPFLIWIVYILDIFDEREEEP